MWNYVCGIMWNKSNAPYLAVSKITADEWECQHQNLRLIASKFSGNVFLHVHFMNMRSHAWCDRDHTLLCLQLAKPGFHAFPEFSQLSIRQQRSATNG